MALPTATNLVTMNWSFNGQPFVEVPAKSTIDLTTMDWAFQGQPFVRNEYGGGIAGWANIAKINGITASSIAKYLGIAVADIAKINGVAV